MKDKTFELLEKMYSEMQEGFREVKKDIFEIKGRLNNVDSRLDNVEKAVVTIENEHGKKLDALFDGYKQNSEKLNHIEKEVMKHDEIIIKKVK